MKEVIASMAQTSISASQGTQPAPAPVLGILVPQTGQTGRGSSSGTQRPAPPLPKFKKTLMESSLKAAPTFFLQTSSLTVHVTQASCKAESSLSGSNCGLHWTQEPELTNPRPSVLIQLGYTSCIKDTRTTQIHTRFKELYPGM